ncbi:MAG: serine/threonine-protein kinase [Mycobacterium sp.]
MPNEDQIGHALPGYDIGGVLGRGGCGIVLSGTHRALQRAVAVKQIPVQFAADVELRRRFDAEARLLAAIDHPHVVPVYDYIVHEDLCLLVMELLPGGTVSQRFSTQGFDAGSAMAVALSCAAGLTAAHKKGVLHRDIKPANLMFAANGSVKLTDFGIAKIVGGDETMMTAAGDVIGTPAYIAPEQARGEVLTPATDVYALATMLYQLLSGTLPFPPGKDSVATLFMHAYEKPTPLQEKAPNIPGPIVDAVMKGLATDPTDRFQSAEAFGIALAEPSAQCWGTDWLIPVGIPVIGADTIVAAATGSGRSAAVAPTTFLPRAAPVRQAEPAPRPSVDLVDLKPSDVAPIQKVLDFRSPRVPFMVATLLGLIAVTVAVIGVGAPLRGGDLQPGTVTVAGVDPATAEVVDIDLSQPIPVTSTQSAAVMLSVDILGLPLGGQEVPLTAGVPASVPPPVNRYLLAGQLTGNVRLGGGENGSTYRFGMHTNQPAYATAFAVGVVVLALFAAAYVESYIRALRRGRSRVSASVGLPISTAILAVAVVGGVWVLIEREPTIATVASSAIVAALAGVAAAVGALRVGSRYRHLRARRMGR